ncbi:MAG: isoleucine--tRNA ligase [Actinobacteria bacterium]|nr:isoleucine--tRNA ligase [Actinomycetota bacterium]
MAEDFKETLNLPKTDFPMKANLPELEPKMLERWAEQNIYEKLMQRKGKGETFILHDGPPYANGDIHVGHALNKVLKDLVCRYNWMKGNYSPFVPGWDCHGQPIEQQVEKQLGEKRKQITQAEFRELCRKYAETYIERQRNQFIRLGVLGTWGKPYLTMDKKYEATNVKTFKELYQKGLVYRGKKPIYWCYKDKTALAEAEIEYYDKTSPSIKVLFKLIEGPQKLNLNNVYAVIWTTTPWTLPANVALAFHPDASYGVYEKDEKRLIIAEELASQTIGEEARKIASFKGAEFEGSKFEHPLFPGRNSVGVLADFVDLGTGTGIVHIAPGHGEDDYHLGVKYNLPMPVPVDDEGFFTDEAGEFSGMHINNGNLAIIERLKEIGMLLESDSITHSYPHCWRCKNPVIFRATEQWFISVSSDGLRKWALDAIEKVNWLPEWSIRRISSMVEQRPDWCISRQRSWGVPIPIIYCADCQTVQGEEEVFNTIEKRFEEYGADSWFKNDVQFFLPKNHKCSSCGSNRFEKEDDIFDVWFESGISHFAVLRNREELQWPADIYLEGSDQHRGWFQSSLLTSVGVTMEAPYKTVLTHGFIVDEEGRKMSKSLGNVVDPLDVVERLGADVLRLWVVSSDYSSDIAVSEQILQRTVDVYRRIRNTIRFMLGNLYDFEPDKHFVTFEKQTSIDRFILMKFKQLYKQVLEAYENYRFHNVVHGIHNFMVVELSSFYLDVLKDRLYADAPDSQERRSTQSAIYGMLKPILKLLAPIIPFTSEQAYDYLPGKKEESIHLELFDDLDWIKIDEDHLERWEMLLKVRKDYLKVYEMAKSSSVLKTMMEAEVFIVPSEGLRDTLINSKQDLYFIFTSRNVNIINEPVSDLPVSQELESGWYGLRKSNAEKCNRCWNYSSDVKEGICLRCKEVLSS